MHPDMIRHRHVTKGPSFNSQNNNTVDGWIERKTERGREGGREIERERKRETQIESEATGGGEIGILRDA